MHELEEAQPLTDPAVSEDKAGEADGSNKKRWMEFRQRIQSSKNYRKKLVRNWSTNVDFRRGKSFNSQDDNDSIAVNLDWSYTKTKHASLFSQVPKIYVAHHPESVGAPWISVYERRINDIMVKAGIESAMDEVMPDVINAAGFGVVLVSAEVLNEQREIPKIDLSLLPPQVALTAMQSGMLFGKPIPMETVPQKVDSRYTIRRISPSDFLWPVDFTGSDFDNAAWIGYTGRIPWAEAVSRFNLTDADKEKLQTEETTYLDKLADDVDKDTTYTEDDKVGYDEIFYNEYQYDTEAKSFSTIHHLVFLHGKTDPVIDEPWKGQIVDPNNPAKIIGSQKKPLRVLTLTYLSDEAIPPSDSAVGRPQVLEINKGRTMANRQRLHSAPWTWFDVNRLDPGIQSALMRGTWKYAIPVQGDGSRVIGTVEQPGLPQETYKFDEIAKLDLQEVWTIGSNQLGVGGNIETKGEANIIQNNFQTKVGRERAKVAAFITGISEVVGGLACVFEDPKTFGEGFDPTISDKLVFSILVDSTILVDATQRLERLNNYIKEYATSGWVVLEPILREIATLSGLDPNVVVKAPEPKAPPPPNVSLRLSGGEDMLNPLLLAFMMKSGQAPEPELIEKAKQLIQLSVMPTPQPPQPGMPPPPPPPNVGDANSDMRLLPPTNKRSDDGKGSEGPQ